MLPRTKRMLALLCVVAVCSVSLYCFTAMHNRCPSRRELSDAKCAIVWQDSKSPFRLPLTIITRDTDSSDTALYQLIRKYPILKCARRIVYENRPVDPARLSIIDSFSAPVEVCLLGCQLMCDSRPARCVGLARIVFVVDSDINCSERTIRGWFCSLDQLAVFRR